MTGRFSTTMLALMMVAAGAQTAGALEVQRVVWGFDGKVVPNEFNPVSILVSNPTQDAFDGELRLQKEVPVGAVGAVLVEPVFVAPYTRRWVQFYPFVQRDYEQWHVSSRPFGIRKPLPKPNHGPPARVIFDQAGSLRRGGAHLKSFPDELFPPFVSATATLDTVVLDYEPRWQKARRQAFADWLRGGGTVHLLLDREGEFPEFGGVLSELNSPLEEFHVGAGTVRRHRRQRDELDRGFVERAIRGIGEPSAGHSQAGPGSEGQGPAVANANAYGPAYGGQLNLQELHHHFHRSLKSMSRADHNWLVIHLMSVVYILVVFPGCWLLGNKRRDYRIVLAVLMGAVVLFSLAFLTVGRRGYGETTAVNTLAVARPLSGGEFDVTAWSNVFVTSGDDYTITHEGTGRLYSTAQEQESVDRHIKCGTGGYFLADIPPFSSREFVSRMKATGPPMRIDAKSWTVGEGQFHVVLTTGPNFPETPHAIYLLYRDTFYETHRRSEVIVSGAPAGSVSEFIRQYESEYYVNYGPWFHDNRPPAEIYRSMTVPLIARSLGLNGQKEAETFSLPGDRVRLFVYAPLPEPLHVQNEKLGRQQGRILYCIDVIDPNEP